MRFCFLFFRGGGEGLSLDSLESDSEEVLSEVSEDEGERDFFFFFF